LRSSPKGGAKKQFIDTLKSALAKASAFYFFSLAFSAKSDIIIRKNTSKRMLSND
jgi:hypothetical protein